MTEAEALTKLFDLAIVLWTFAAVSLAIIAGATVSLALNQK